MTNNKHTLSAGAFMASFSSAVRLVAPAAAPAVAGRPRVMVVDRWDGTRFVEVELRWNGTTYAEVR
jgi:hypothetical protein